VVGVLVLGLSLVFASPDPPSVTFKEWAESSPSDFVSTTATEVAGTSLSATYGPPYQTTAQNGSTQGFGPFSPQKWFGERIPVDTFQDFVATPLGTMPDNAAVLTALDTWSSASSSDQTTWATNYATAVGKATFANGAYDVPAGDYGPLGDIVEAQYEFALAGGLDNAIVANPTDASIWYSNDQTFALLYFGDSGEGGGASDCVSAGTAPAAGAGCWFYNQALGNTAPRYGGYLDGGTWGVINEVGNWPGAWWLFPYSFWYQWGPGVTSGNADIYAMAMTGLVTMAVVFLPWIPGLRSIPKASRVYRLMWGDYYRLVEQQKKGS
jgi:hypothetical protein